MKHYPQTETIYNCPENLVTVIRKSSDLRRWPRHDYPCVLVLLRPREGTRVRKHGHTGVEFMPSFDELRAILDAIDPALAKRLPKAVRNKPEKRKANFARLNHHRHLTRKQR